MGRFNWGPDGPPEEAYSRVTEPERFRPLHQWSLNLLSGLEATYEVTREEGYSLDPELERTPPARPTVRLTPGRDGAAPIVVAFTEHSHPAIYVRFGRFHTEPFPDCGCDACDEGAEDQFESFQEVVEAVVAGQFREWFRLQPDGSGQVGREFWSENMRGSGRSRVAARQRDALHRPVPPRYGSRFGLGTLATEIDAAMTTVATGGSIRWPSIAGQTDWAATSQGIARGRWVVGHRGGTLPDGKPAE